MTEDVEEPQSGPGASCSPKTGACSRGYREYSSLPLEQWHSKLRPLCTRNADLCTWNVHLSVPPGHRVKSSLFGGQGHSGQSHLLSRVPEAARQDVQADTTAQIIPVLQTRRTSCGTQTELTVRSLGRQVCLNPKSSSQARV